MITRILLSGTFLLVSACQSAIPFYSKPANEPEWFKAKAAQADAKGFPSSRSVPDNPKGLTTPAKRDNTLQALQKAGDRVRNDPRASLATENTVDPEKFAKQGQKETIVPPLVDDEARPD